MKNFFLRFIWEGHQVKYDRNIPWNLSTFSIYFEKKIFEWCHSVKKNKNLACKGKPVEVMEKRPYYSKKYAELRLAEILHKA